MNYFFFDIDGTLLLSGGAGRVAMQRVMAEMFDIVQLPDLPVHGRTDRAIISDLFTATGLNLTDTAYREFTRRYHVELDDCIGQCRGQLLSGVTQLLTRLADQSSVSLGLLTGNSRDAAMTKISHFGIRDYFVFGGFGHEHDDRNAVAHAALDDCRRWANPEPVDPGNAWVIGDTVSDVRCARAIGANVIGVATGGSSRRQLEEAGADMVLDDLTNPHPVLAVCGNLGAG